MHKLNPDQALPPLLLKQFSAPKLGASERVVNVSGGAGSARSLRQLSDWCAAKWGAREIGSDPAVRRFDIPWIVLDSSKAGHLWDWRPATPVEAILREIAAHAEAHPDWLEVSHA